MMRQKHHLTRLTFAEGLVFCQVHCVMKWCLPCEGLRFTKFRTLFHSNFVLAAYTNLKGHRNFLYGLKENKKVKVCEVLK